VQAMHFETIYLHIAQPSFPWKKPSHSGGIRNLVCCSSCGRDNHSATPPEGSFLNWDRCYDHNFLPFLTIFCEKIGVLLKNQCYDEIFLKIIFVFSQKRHFFAEFFGENILKNHNIGPWFSSLQGKCLANIGTKAFSA
jgi:hypothetical protein